MFKKILVANRGEIACRVLQSAQRLGVATVAVYSEADAKARHVRMADEAFCIGAAPVSESYLQIERVLDVMRKTGAEAVHPGYGLLSENAAFARAIESLGRVFIGPEASCIEAMGSKTRARAAAESAGVPVLPGSPLLSADDDEIEAWGQRIGFPLLIKATAGGGGIGMKKVKKPEKLLRAAHQVQDQAERFFGDRGLFLERLVEEPHHCEVQILGDGLGNAIHLWDRECSVQRRHQKVLEEAPGPFLDETQREALCQAACALAASVSYRGAGTVEFLADASGAFYFLEMNTRLQVEHPVTEAITGMDLVEQQFRIALGEGLPCTQAEVTRHGHAIEFRICAEDPARRFAPCPGTIDSWDFPEGEGIRLDTGVEVGTEVTPFYDSLLAKLIVYGSDRNEAIRRAADALARCRVEGIQTNLELHRQLLENERIQSGNYDTGILLDMGYKG